MGIVILFASHAKSFTIGLPETAQQNPYQSQVENVFNLLYEGIEEEVFFVYLPFHRMIRMMQDDQIDAVAYQFNFETDETLGMIRVPEPLTQLRLYLGCLKENRCTFDANLKFVVTADALYANQICKQNALQCLVLKTPEHAHKAVKESMVDAFIMERSPYIAEPCLQDIGFKVYAIANTEINIYHFIAQANSDIAQPLAERLKKLKREFQIKNIQECSDMVIESFSENS